MEVKGKGFFKFYEPAPSGHVQNRDFPGLAQGGYPFAPPRGAGGLWGLTAHWPELSEILWV